MNPKQHDHSLTSTVITSILSIIITLLLQPSARAQQLQTNDIYREYIKTLKINNTLPLEESYHGVIDDTLNHPWDTLPNPVLSDIHQGSTFTLAPYDPLLRNYWQSRQPGGNHDGPVWQGRGLTTDFSAGFYIRYGILSASFRPHLIFNQNRDFGLSPYSTGSDRSKFAYPLSNNIDWPQRFGNKPFWSFDWGQTYIRADYHGWSTGISNELMHWGPARQNALLLDSNSPGFRHFFISTSQPKNVAIGTLSTNLFWGRLFESDYFDDNADNNERYISGLTLSFTPQPTPGLQLGINRIFYETIPPNGIPVGDLLKIFEAFTKVNFTSGSNAGGNDQADQLLSVFGRWRLPKSGLEIYGEWARTDHSWNWRDFFTEPEHSRGYTIGLQKTFTLSQNRILSFNAELTQLEASKTGLFRGYPTFYYHGKSQQGYTNEGQLLGASIGPGSSSQYLSSSIFFGKGRIKLFAQRVAQNNDFLYTSDAMLNKDIQSPENNKYWLHNVEMRFGASLHYFYQRFETGVGLTYRRELNDHYIFKNDKTHLGIKFSLRYRLSRLR